MRTPSTSASPLRSQFVDDTDMREIVEMFVSGMPEKIAALGQLWEQQRLDDLKRLAHQLKGAGGGYGFPTVGEAAGRVESSIDAMAYGSGAKVEQLRAQFEDLITLCRSVSM
ncbi:MAG: Hpt domain-containing protein [Phycisphaerales bacterium]